MADDGKRTEVISTKASERVALDLMRIASLHERSPSEYMYLLLRQHLYGEIVRLNGQGEQVGKVNKVDRGDS